MNSFLINILRLSCFAALLGFVAPIWSARAEVLISRYNVSMDGIPAGEAVLHTTYDAKRYEVKVSADVGTILDSTKIQGSASGVKAGGKLTPERFQVAFSGSEEGSLEINFKGESGNDREINPRLRGVFDPLSAMLATSLKPQSANKNPCDHMLPIFTGKVRFDLSLHPKPTGEEEKDHNVVVCGADYASMPGEPLKAIDMEIIFSKMSKPKFWLVERISLPTNKGTVTIERAETSISGS